MKATLRKIAIAVTTLSVGALLVTGHAAADPAFGTGQLIINEYNAVGPEKFLEEGHDPAFGNAPVLGNGGDWLELVVVEDHLDISGWRINWENLDPDAGSLTFTNAWSSIDLRAGTIITIRRDGGSSVTDASYNPCGAGDWNIAIDANDTTYVTQSGHAFKTDNDGWIAQIRDNNNVLVQDWVGEQGLTDPDVIWAGSGINSEEVGKLEANPSSAAADPSTNPNYQDGNCSSYGQPNCWNNGLGVQDFDGLRTCAP